VRLPKRRPGVPSASAARKGERIESETRLRVTWAVEKSYSRMRAGTDRGLQNEAFAETNDRAVEWGARISEWVSLPLDLSDVVSLQEQAMLRLGGALRRPAWQGA
jgi:hypothetical protein